MRMGVGLTLLESWKVIVGAVHHVTVVGSQLPNITAPPVLADGHLRIIQLFRTVFHRSAIQPETWR